MRCGSSVACKVHTAELFMEPNIKYLNSFNERRLLDAAIALAPYFGRAATVTAVRMRPIRTPVEPWIPLVLRNEHVTYLWDNNAEKTQLVILGAVRPHSTYSGKGACRSSHREIPHVQKLVIPQHPTRHNALQAAPRPAALPFPASLPHQPGPSAICSLPPLHNPSGATFPQSPALHRLLPPPLPSPLAPPLRLGGLFLTTLLPALKVEQRAGLAFPRELLHLADGHG